MACRESTSNFPIRSKCVLVSVNKGFFFFLVALLFCCKGVIGDGTVEILDASGFIEFVSNVNSGTGYYGTTVFLDSDLSLSSKSLEPIGNTSSNYFRGVFDGQGYSISDLKMSTSSSQYTGLFGYSEGLTIRNAVLDSSCSITSSFSGSRRVYVGGIIGYCKASSGQCNIENNVNMADVTFNGEISGNYDLYIGGIVGELYSYSYSSYVKNCANYGSVTHSGISSYSYIGGTVGYLWSSNSAYVYIQNCLNYGAITYSGTISNRLYLGGIAGYSYYYPHIENCVSAGRIFTQNPSSEDNRIGSIVGYVGSYTYINYCYYTNELGEYNLYGKGTPESSSYTLSYDNTTFELSGTVSVGSYTGTSLINALNVVSDYYFLRGYSKWLLNRDSKNVDFTINRRISPITINSQIILLPSLASEGNITFSGWYNDSECTYLLESFEITEDKTLYGRSEENTNNYTITFDTRGGSSVAPITAQFGTVVSLPNSLTRGHCSVAFWETEHGYNLGLSLTMPARNFTLYVVWLRFRIATLDDFTDFFRFVNSGITYSGVVVYLDSDLSLSGETLEPIGKDRINQFFGVFDGQGHIISDFKIGSSSQYTGLFGYSEGLTIRNVVLDSSCSITSSFNGSNSVYAGGIIGYCQSNSGQCNIENSVNMADVVFNGIVSGPRDLNLGGIAGWLCSSNYEPYVKNCANYGSVTQPGVSTLSRAGGVVGYLFGSKYNYLYVYNCLNYGAITHSGTTSSSICLGGIAGYSEYTYIENCVSVGEISSTKSSYIGSFVGYAYSYTYINYCYYTSGLSGYKMYGYAYSTPSTSYTLGYDSTTFGLSGTVSVGGYTRNSLVGALNAASDYYLLRDYSKWLLNKNGKSVNFIINSRTSPISMDSQIILLPSLASEGNVTFSGWYTDVMLTLPFTDNEVNTEATLYGMFCKSSNYSVTFDANGGDASSLPLSHSMVITCNNTYRGLVNPTRGGYAFVGWFTERGGEKIESGASITNFNNHTLYAHWSANNYTVTFDVSDEVNLNVTSIAVTFNSTYKELPTPSKTGYMFIGWFTNETNGTKVTNETVLTTPDNHTLYAHWSANNYTVTLNVSDEVNLNVTSIAVIFNSTYGELPTPTKTGYVFIGWFTNEANGTEVTSETVVTISDNHTLYAQWIANNYTVTLDLGNGTIIVETFKYNETIKLPQDIAREGCIHTGWNNNTIANMPAENITVNALWDCTHNHSGDKSKPSSNIGAVAGCVVGGIIAIILILVVVLLLFFKKKEGATQRRRRNGIEMKGMNLRIVEKSLNASEADCCDEDNSSKTLSDSLSKLYSGSYKVPTIAEALYMAGLSENRINTAVELCANAGTSAAKEGKLFNGFEKEDAAAVALYTFDFGGGDYEGNPYRIINRALATRSNDNDLRKASGLLYLVLGALRKLPRYTGSNLYRGIREGVDVTSYKEGSTVVWRGLSSTSPDMSATKAFLAKNGSSGKAEGTLFVIDKGWGYDIQPYSLFPEEAEILLEPERHFRVQSVIEAELTVINLEMIDTPVILPEVFGESVC